MPDSNKPDDFEKVINMELMSISEAKVYICEKLACSEKYFYTDIRPWLKPVPTFIDFENRKAKNLKIPKYQVDELIYDIKKKLIDRSERL